MDKSIEPVLLVLVAMGVGIAIAAARVGYALGYVASLVCFTAVALGWYFNQDKYDPRVEPVEHED